MVMITGGQFTGKWGHITGEKIVKQAEILIGVKLHRRQMLVFLKESQIYKFDDYKQK